MREDLDQIIEAIREGQAVEIGGMSTGERCYVALSAGRYDLLPDGLDPIEAWNLLDWRWQDRIARWRMWPQDWSERTRKIEAAVKILACCANLGIHDLGDIEGGRGPVWAAFADDVCAGLKRLVEALRDYGRHDPGCSAEIDETTYRCRCGWKRERVRIFGE